MAKETAPTVKVTETPKVKEESAPIDKSSLKDWQKKAVATAEKSKRKVEVSAKGNVIIK